MSSNVTRQTRYGSLGVVFGERGWMRHGRWALFLCGLVLAVLSVFASVAAGQDGAGGSGVDVSGAGVHAEAVRELVELGVLEGTECAGGSWCWDDPVARDVAAVWLVRVLDGGDGEVPGGGSRFGDVSGRWEGHVERLAVLGVTVGCSQTRCCSAPMMQ